MAVVAGTALYAAGLLLASDATVPGWLLPALAVVTVVAVALLLISTGRRAGEPVLRAGLGAAVLAVLLVVHGRGAFDTPFESTRTAAEVDELFVDIPQLVARSLPSLEKARAGAPDLLAVQSSAVASVFSYPSGAEVLPIGGFTADDAATDARAAAHRHRAGPVPPGPRVPQH